MTSFKLFNQRSGSVVALFAVLLSTVASAVVPTLAFAAQVTERSMEMSDSVKGATGVSYNIKFKAVQAATGGFIVDFCTNSPLVGTSCTAPTGMVTTGATNGGGATSVSGADGRLTVTKAITANEEVDVTVGGITNPTAGGTAGVLYVRIVTYDTLANYTSPTSLGTHKDTGAVAVALTDSIGVTAAVLESMTFCVASVDITNNCANASANPPTIEIGEMSGSVRSLSASAISPGNVYAQLSTNAARGAIVNLKSMSTGCGGMILVGGPEDNCYIAPAQNTNITAGQAKFGVLVAPFAGTATGQEGTLAAIGNYNDTTYALNYNDTDESTGVTSTYGDPLFSTTTAVNNKSMQLTFGASVTNMTPAGKYAANMSLIATGTF